MIKLDERLNAVLCEIYDTERVVDIGADHGKLSVSAVLSGRAKSAVAVDISAKSLEKSKILATEQGVPDKFAFFVCDGADFDWRDDDTVVIAGMGGEEIIHIIGKKNKPLRLILVAHKDLFLLRCFLNDRLFYASKDYVVSAGDKFYDVIVIDREWGRPYTEAELYLGKNTPPTAEYVQKTEARRIKLAEYVNENAAPTIRREKEILDDAVIKRGR